MFYGKLLDILIRILKGEKLEKASPEEIRGRLGFLSSLCTFAIIFFHTSKLLHPLFDRVRDITAFIIMT
ncbi:MAG: hypothetical protein WC082_11825, partial [Victivallales bacterium]